MDPRFVSWSGIYFQCKFAHSAFPSTDQYSILLRCALIKLLSILYWRYRVIPEKKCQRNVSTGAEYPIRRIGKWCFESIYFQFVTTSIKKGKKSCTVPFNANVTVIPTAPHFYHFDIFILEKEKHVAHICVLENEF